MLSLRRPAGRAILILAVLAALGAWNLAAASDAEDDEARSARSQAVDQLLVEVDRSQLCYWERYRRYSDNVAELTRNAAGAELTGSTIVGLASRHRLDVELSVGRGGRTYIQRITGEGVDTYVERRGADFVDYGDRGWRRLKDRC